MGQGSDGLEDVGVFVLQVSLDAEWPFEDPVARFADPPLRLHIRGKPNDSPRHTEAEEG